VECEDFEQIHIRGDSWKQAVDFKESLCIFILHGYKIYFWSHERESLKFVVSVSYKIMKPIDDDHFLFGNTLELEE